MPGGRIIITRDLLERAEAPEEVAGVLAHELGHVAHRHSEAQLIRSIGLQLLLSAVTGGSSDTLGSVAGLAAILRYTRAAEREADAYANAILQKAAIDPMGLKRFFERLREQEGASAAGVWGRLGNVLATHPGTEERIELIKPLPEGVAARPVLSEAQWRELKRICR
jgi:predicted Zn-dependent protease